MKNYYFPFDLESIIRRANEAYFAANMPGIPWSLLKKNQIDEAADEEPIDWTRNEDERLDDPRHDQCRQGKFVP